MSTTSLLVKNNNKEGGITTLVINNKFKKTIIYLLLFITIISSLPLEVFAHRAYFLQVLVDKTNYQYVSNILSDNQSSVKFESGHIENKLGDFREVNKHKIGSGSEKYKMYDKGFTDKAANTFKDYPRTFTFNPYQIKDEDSEKTFKDHKHAGRADVDRALEISSELISNINQILYIINDSKAFTNIDEMIKASEVIINKGTSAKGWKVSSGTKKIKKNNKEYSVDTIVVSKGKERYEFTSAMTKGYSTKKLEDGRPNPLYNKKFANDKEYTSKVGDKLTIEMLIIQANFTYVINGHSADDVGQYSKEGTLSKKISEFFSSLAIGLRNALGLYSIDEMVYNTGARDARVFSGGLMSKDWMNKSISFHLIFQAIAWMLLIVSIVKTLFQQNIQTLSTTQRMSMMQGVKDLIITGFLLISVLVFINTATMVNLKIVEVFETTVPQFNHLGNSSDIESLGGTMMTLYYLGISVYLNFIYIVRSIMLSVLIATAPFFIMTLAFQSKEKRLFNSWLKEFSAYLFIQSIHAFVISFIASAQMGARGIEVAVSSLSLIIITNFFRNMVLGDSGGVMAEVAGGVTKAGSGVGIALRRNSRSNQNNDYHEGVSDFNRSSNDLRGARQNNNSTIPGAKENRDRQSHSTSVPSQAQSKKNLENSHFGVSTKANAKDEANAKYGSESSTEIGGIGNAYESMSSKPFKNSGDINKDNITSGLASAGKTIGKVAAGGAMVAAGGAATMVSTATGGKGVLGASIMGEGMAKVGEAGAETLAGASNVFKSGVNTLTKDEGGNILGIDRANNGDYLVSRDREMLKDDGFVGANKTSEGHHNIIYNSSNLSSENKANLEKIEEMSKDSTKTQYLRARGIESITKHNNGNFEVQYNSQGLENLGYKDIYTTGNRVVEVKDNKHEVGSRLTYNPEQAKPMEYEGIIN